MADLTMADYMANLRNRLNANPANPYQFAPAQPPPGPPPSLFQQFVRQGIPLAMSAMPGARFPFMGGMRGGGNLRMGDFRQATARDLAGGPNAVMDMPYPPLERGMEIPGNPMPRYGPMPMGDYFRPNRANTNQSMLLDPPILPPGF